MKTSVRAARNQRARQNGHNPLMGISPKKLAIAKAIRQGQSLPQVAKIFDLPEEKIGRIVYQVEKRQLELKKLITYMPFTSQKPRRPPRQIT